MREKEISCGRCKFNTVRTRDKNHRYYASGCNATHCALFALAALEHVTLWAFFAEQVGFEAAKFEVHKTISRMSLEERRAFVVFRRITLQGGTGEGG